MTIQPPPLQTLPVQPRGGFAQLWAMWFTVLRDGVNAIAADLAGLLGAAWQTDWTPTYTPTGGMTMSGISTNAANYLRGVARVDFNLFFSATLGGALTNEIDVSLPIAPTSDITVPTCLVLSPGGDPGAWVPGVCFIGGKLLVRQSGLATYSAGSWSFFISGSYRI